LITAFKEMEVKIVINDPETGKSYQVNKEDISPLIGKQIGDKVSLSFLGLDDYEGEITGGGYITGHPMDKRFKTMGLVSDLFEPNTFNNRSDVRQRKKVAGAIIGDKTSQINIKIIKKGVKPIEEVIPAKKK
jgi:small subunit ribosomal protein S6e